MAAGAIAWAMVLDRAPMQRKIIDMDSVHMNENSKKMKNASTSRRRLVRKYNVKLKVMAMKILEGRSHIMDATASANGWYSAMRECFSTIGRCSYRVKIWRKL